MADLDVTIPDALPCPFCGALAQYMGDEAKGYLVRCQGMRCFGPETSRYGILAEAIEAWNRRSPPPDKDRIAASGERGATNYLRALETIRDLTGEDVEQAPEIAETALEAVEHFAALSARPIAQEDLIARLEARAREHDSLAARANFKGNAKYPALPEVAKKRQYHEQSAADLRSCIDALRTPVTHPQASEADK